MPRNEFSEETRRRARARAGVFCECQRQKSHNHLFGRCGMPLALFDYEFHHKTACEDGGSSALSNCEVLCTYCHRKVTTAQRSA